MGLFEQFPYANFHELNLDWLLRIVKEIGEKVDNFDDDIEAAVEKYFEDHPGMTIPDGSVTLRKLADELKAAYYRTENVTYYFPELTDGTDTAIRGSCFLAVTPTRTILFDAGSSSQWYAINSALSRWYAEGKFSNIDILVISHFHADHVANVANILSNYPHDNLTVYMPPDATNCYNWSGVAVYKTQLMADLTAAGVTSASIHVINADAIVPISPGALIFLKFCNTRKLDYDHYDTTDNNYNNYSMVSTLVVGNTSMLYPGDLLAEGQKWVLSTRGIDRPNIYVLHHHGYQNDDYLPYLQAVNADIVINEVTHKTAVTDGNNEESAAMSYFTGWKGSVAYSSYVIDQSVSGVAVMDGIEKLRGGVAYTDYQYYVDNTYKGVVHDGTPDHPFTEINEAINWIPAANNTRVYINIKPSATPYRFVWLLNLGANITIRRDPNESGTVSVDGAYVRGCPDVEFVYITFNGAGRGLYGMVSEVTTGGSIVTFYNCTFDGTNLTTSGSAPKVLLLIANGDAYVRDCSFSNAARGIVGSGSSTHAAGRVYLTNSAFDNISAMCLDAYYLNITIASACTITNSPLWIGTISTYALPIAVRGNAITAATLPLIDSKITSMPFYKSSSYPGCIIRNGAVINLNGTNVPIS